MHSTKNLEDGYIGSGKRLWYSINKYGKENHNCERLEFLPSRKELAKREKEIINEELLSDELCINLKLGGDGGFEFLNEHLTPEKRTKAGLAGPFANIDKYDEVWKNKVNARRREGIIKGHAEGRMHKISKEASDKGRIIATSQEIIKKRKETLVKIKHQQGEKNSQFGTCWIYHELIGSKKCKKELLLEYIEQGWIKGRKF